jgi:diguanylate cyclase (GGDEF)-like protein
LAEPGDTARETEPQPGAFSEQTLADLDQTRSDVEQTLSDADQTASDADQSVSDADELLAAKDQHASDQDQAAADREQARAPTDLRSERGYDVTRAERASATAERGSTAASRAAMALTRSREAMQRDDTARLRDLSALARDRTAASRDRNAERQAATLAESGAATDLVVGALEASGAAHRARAAADRERAAADRERAAQDRAQAALDRRQARVALREAYLDDLTGLYTRRLGLLTLQHEIDRAHRSGEPLVVAMLDVDGLKQVNDREGHAAGDALLRDAAAAIVSKLRSYDPVMRMGGDEFVCAFPNTPLEPAARQVQEMKAEFGQRQPTGSLSVGLAQLEPEETLENFLARGDAELYRAKASG